MFKMKKLLVISLLFISLWGCMDGGKGKEPVLDTYPIDMSIYEGMKSVDHHFLGVSPQELLRCYKEEGSGIFYLGFKGCGVCQSMTQYVEEAGEKLDKVIYYLDCTSTEYPSLKLI